MTEKVCIAHPELSGCVAVSPRAVAGWRLRGWVPVEEVSATVADAIEEPTAEEGDEEREEINE